MNLKHFFIIGMFTSFYDESSDGFTNGFIDLIFRREGNEGIVDSVNHIADKIDETIYSDDEAALYDACLLEFQKYVTR